MSYQFKPHVPAFIDIESPREVIVQTRQEFMKIHSHWNEIKGFDKIVLGGYDKHIRGYTIMALFDNGKEWWVLGWVNKKRGLRLPRFEIIMKPRYKYKHFV